MSSSVLAAGMMAAVLILSGCANYTLWQTQQALTEAQVAECQALPVGSAERTTCLQRLLDTMNVQAAGERELIREVVRTLQEEQVPEGQ